MDILRKPYEISLWEDVLTFVVRRADGIKIEYEEKIPSDATGQVIAQYYKERKICIIGSDTMTTPIRATSGRLNSKINGENILTFNMFSHYLDEDSGELYENPFIKLLVNERKIKLRYGALDAKGTKWYDLVIKNVQENSDTKTYTYTAKDLFVNELSKSGFNLVLDAELENNMGTIQELAEVVLDESDWQLEESDVLRQFIEEPLYKIQLKQSLTVKDMMSSQTLTIPTGAMVYGFYSNIVNRQQYLQLLYAEKYEINDDFVITNSKNWYIDNAEYTEEGLPTFASSMAISEEYRGERLVRKATTKYDSTIDKYVSVYKQDNGDEIYGYTETEYTSPLMVRNFITNGRDYESTAGWEIGGTQNGVFPTLEATTVPHILDVTNQQLESDETFIKAYLKFNVSELGQKLYNSGLIDSRAHAEAYVPGNKYVFRIKYGKQGGTDVRAKTVVSTDTDLDIIIGKYQLNNGAYTIQTKYFEGTVQSSAQDAYGYKTVILTCLEGLTYAEMVEMTKSLGLFIEPKGIGTIYIEDVQFFPYVDNHGEPLLPDAIAQGEVKTLYLYYKPNDSYKSIDEVQYIYKNYEPANFAEVYSTTYEKVRSINASESNRFNILQDLCEIFECWVNFRIEHNEQTGEILLDENYQQKKYVSFKEYIGKDNYAGFKYGINLKQIQRTLDSDAIVSKLVVKNNSNEFATDGSCNIARAAESPNGENFLLDFSYYIHQGMLGMAETTNDLYLDTNGYIGYYKQLRRINNARDQYIKEQSGLMGDIDEYNSQYQTYSISVSESQAQLRDNLSYFKSLCGQSFDWMLDHKNNNWWKNEEVIKIASSIGRLRTLINTHEDLKNRAKLNLDNAQSRFDELNNLLTSKTDENSLLVQKEKINKRFYKKYSRFLQEGSWISEDYVDDNLYYLDAQSTLHTSSQPKVTYNINVLEISQVEGYENYEFALGDKTTIEDTEFFGWVMKEGVQTPYKEEIVVTELSIMLDSPEQNQIKVQNYKSQFEDLFQRMAATTQSVEYSTGKYQKVSNIINEDGTITIDALQNSMVGNAITLQNAKDQSVIWDETGITTVSLSNPSEMVRIVSGGIFVSADGGVNWSTGVTGKGINAGLIYGGRIDTQEINIVDGSFPSFRWDSAGISAYEYEISEQTGEPTNFNYGKFVRLDQYGLYGMDGYPDFHSAESDQDGVSGEERIWRHANFALTWKGFSLKSKHDKGGYISITSDDDFEVINRNGKTQIKIGMIDSGTEDQDPIYGIRICDGSGAPVLENSSDGRVWIRDELVIGTLASTVSIGYLEKTKLDTDFHEVFNANDNFIIYEDGEMVASKGTFTGTIYATGGKIGNMEIADMGTPEYEIAIESSAGTVFKNLDDLQDDEVVTILTATLYYGTTPATGNLSYKWYNLNSPDVTIGIEQELKVTKKMFDSDDITQFGCKITRD